MNRITLYILTLTATFCNLVAIAGTQSLKSFNEDWQFYNGVIQGAECVDFDSSTWRQLDLPHDWAIEGEFSSDYNARCGGLPYHGTGWYRKEFFVKRSEEGRVINVIFDGAMSNSTIWVNGEMVGERKFGYVGFKFDISKYLKYGEENIIAVKLMPEDHSSRWYPGAGLYRNVWISSDLPTHIPHWGTFVTTPTVTDQNAVVQVETEIQNSSSSQQPLTIEYQIISPNNKVVAKKSEKVVIEPSTTKKFGIFMDVEKPMKWDLETPNMYTLSTKVIVHHTAIDESTTPFGIRHIAYDRDGFYLNDRKIRFNGVCIHHDNGPLGGVLYERADERKIQIMKEMGANAIRTAHNPPSQEFLDLCDKMGMLVVCEAYDMWRISKTPQDYSQHFDKWAAEDLKNIIVSSRNHPSIIMWSTGNEIQDQYEFNGGWQTAKMLTEVCHQYDPTRPTTTGFHHYPAPYQNNMVQQVDIVGVNYHPYNYGDIRRDYPHLAIYASETTSSTSSRGVYFQPAAPTFVNETNQVSSYDYGLKGKTRPMDLEMDAQAKHPYVMGQFIWTGFDYLGEPTPYGGKDNFTNGYWNDNWPSHSSYFGAVDLVGLPKDRFYFYQSNWTDKPMVHLLPHWNWSGMEGDKIDVNVYTNCEEAELFLNGKSLGRKVKGVDVVDMECYNMVKKKMETLESKYRLCWQVPYQAGEIKVIGYSGGKKMAEKAICTASEPAKIVLSADRDVITADGRDLSYVTIRVEDKDGNLCPMADNLINFSVEGAGELLAVGNGNSASLESFHAPYIKAFSGMCVAILKSSADSAGTITLLVTSSGLTSADIEIKTKQ